MTTHSAEWERVGNSWYTDDCDGAGRWNSPYAIDYNGEDGELSVIGYTRVSTLCRLYITRSYGKVVSRQKSGSPSSLYLHEASN